VSGLSHDRYPHAGVNGDVLSDDEFVAGGNKLEVGRLANLLWAMTLVGNPAPRVSEQHWRMRSPRDGDRVVVLDATYGMQPERIAKAVGYLVGTRDEWTDSDEDWEASIADEFDDQERMTERVWYVQYGPDPSDVCRWTNCNVVSIESAEVESASSPRG